MISVVLPCRNEEEGLSDVLDEIDDVLTSYDHEVIVSDSSSDASPRIARQHGVRLVKHDKNGYGRAIKEGVRAAKGDRILIADADYTYDFRDAPRLLERDESFVIGKRAFDASNMSLTHRLGNLALSALSNFLFGSAIKDWHCGMRVIDKDVFDSLNLHTDGMEFASEMIIKALRRDIKMSQVAINYRPRKGESKLQTWNDGWKHLRFLVVNAPERTLYPLAFLCLLPVFLASQMHYKIIAVLASFHFFSTGLYSEIYLHNHLESHKEHIRWLYKYLDLRAGMLFSFSAVLAGFLVSATPIEIVFVLGGLQLLSTVYYLSVLGIE
jgi:glycosyltransferase involved in cell wall biosynthesis